MRRERKYFLSLCLLCLLCTVSRAPTTPPTLSGSPDGQARSLPFFTDGDAVTGAVLAGYPFTGAHPPVGVDPGADIAPDAAGSTLTAAPPRMDPQASHAGRSQAAGFPRVA